MININCDGITGKLLLIANKSNSDRQKAINSYKKEHANWLRMKKATDTNDGKLALYCLELRSDYEYEGYKIEYLEDV